MNTAIFKQKTQTAIDLHKMLEQGKELQHKRKLTEVKPKKSAATFAQHIQESKLKAASSYKPTLDECREIVYAVFRAKLLESMSKPKREIYRDFNALMMSATPKAEVVISEVSKLKVDKADVIQAFGAQMWEAFSKETQARYAKALRLETDERKQELVYYRGVFNAQQKMSVSIDDEMYLKFEEIGEQIAAYPLDRIDSHILPDFQKEETTAMRASEIYSYLLTRSKGTIQHTPQMLANLLPALGYEYLEKRVKGKNVKFYLCKLFFKFICC